MCGRVFETSGRVIETCRQMLKQTQMSKSATVNDALKIKKYKLFCCDIIYTNAYKNIFGNYKAKFLPGKKMYWNNQL